MFVCWLVCLTGTACIEALAFLIYYTHTHTPLQRQLMLLILWFDREIPLFDLLWVIIGILPRLDRRHNLLLVDGQFLQRELAAVWRNVRRFGGILVRGHLDIIARIIGRGH